MSRPKADDPGPTFEEVRAALPTEKRCPLCGQIKPASEYYLCRSRLTVKLQSRCKSCCRERAVQKVAEKKAAGTYEQHLAERRQDYHDRKSADESFNKKRYVRNRAKALEYNTASRATPEGRLLILLHSAMSRVRKSGLPLTISQDDLVAIWNAQGGKCAVTGMTMRLEMNPRGQRFFNPFNVSLDRVDASKGYDLGNVRLVCVVVNLALNRFGDEVFDEMCEAYVARKRGDHAAAKKP